MKGKSTIPADKYIDMVSGIVGPSKTRVSSITSVLQSLFPSSATRMQLIIATVLIDERAGSTPISVGLVSAAIAEQLSAGYGTDLPCPICLRKKRHYSETEANRLREMARNKRKRTSRTAPGILEILKSMPAEFRIRSICDANPKIKPSAVRGIASLLRDEGELVLERKKFWCKTSKFGNSATWDQLEKAAETVQ